MKAKIAATVILLYTLVLFVGSLEGAFLGHDFDMMTIPVTGLLLIGPAIGIYLRADWCRIYLGIWFAFVLAIFLYLPFRGEFHFSSSYVALLLLATFPIYLLFFYAPLKNYTRQPVTKA